MKKWLALLLSLLVLTACSGGVTQDEPFKLQLEEKTTYEPNAAASPETNSPTAAPETKSPTEASETLGPEEARVEWNIVSLSPTATEMLFAMGLGSWVVAVDNASDWPPEAPMIEDLSGWDPNIEIIADFDPDLVIVSDYGLYEKLAEIGFNTYPALAPQSLSEVFEQIKALGTLTGEFAAADLLVDTMTERIYAAVSSVERPAEPLTYYHELDDTLYSVTSSTFIGQIYSMMGLINIADAADEGSSSGGYPQLSQEYVLEADPDIIFYADAQCCGQSVETIAARPGWSALSAVRNGNIVEINADISSRWGPRLPEFVEQIAATLAALNE